MVETDGRDGTPSPEGETLLAENERLRRRVAELERASAEATSGGTEPRRFDEAMRERLDLLESILANAPLTIYAKAVDGRYLFASSRALTFAGVKWEELRGKTDFDFLPREIAESYLESEREVMSTATCTEREDTLPLPDGNHHYVTVKFPLRGAEGQISGTCSVSTEITTYKRAELENRRLQDEIIHMQAASLRALSTPLLPIGRGVVVMPLIGHIDSARAQRILETLLEGIVAHSAHTVILDVTGVPILDHDVASSLMRTAQAAKLLGASVIMTGIQPTIAHTLVTLGADLSGILTEGTLESGINRALKRL